VDQEVNCRIDAVRPGLPSVEHLPAALSGRRLHGAAGADRAPVDGSEIHVHVETLQEVGSDIALGLRDGLVLGDQAGDRLARVARLRQRFLGGLHQLEPEIRHAVLGNAGTIISFRVRAEDAPYLEQEFQKRFDQIDLTQLGNHHVYLKLMIDGQPSRSFSAITLATSDSRQSR